MIILFMQYDKFSNKITKNYKKITKYFIKNNNKFLLMLLNLYHVLHNKAF